MEHKRRNPKETSIKLLSSGGEVALFQGLHEIISMLYYAHTYVHTYMYAKLHIFEMNLSETLLVTTRQKKAR
jgi:hypothetical protein